MSVFAVLPMANDWQSHRLGTGSALFGSGTTPKESSLGLGIGRIQTSTLERPGLRSIHSFPASGASAFGSTTTHNPETPARFGDRNPVVTTLQDGLGKASMRTVPQSGQPSTGSAPTSPCQPISSDLPEELPGESNDDYEDEEEFSDYDGGGSDGGDGKEEQPERTAEQRRNDKRKLKRFRLSHLQTRFLMGEFTRQAHPDAAQRERLSKEIPGLSPRQVQVWFQNRRAKLKRLTADDRDKMMKSRALPEDFDMSQSLHLPFHPGLGQSYPSQYPPSLHSPASYNPSQFHDSTLSRSSLMLSGLRKPSQEESTISPIGISSNYNAYYNAPSISNISGQTTSLSPSIDRGIFSYLGFSQPTRPGPSPSGSRTTSFSSGLAPHIPRLNIGQERLSSPKPEAIGSPLRSSMSYGTGLDYAPNSAGMLPASNNSSILGMRNLGVGTGSLQRPEESPYLGAQLPRQTSSLAQSRSNFPPNLDLRSTFTRSLYSYAQSGQSQGSAQVQSPHTSGLASQATNLSHLQNQPQQSPSSIIYQQSSLTSNQSDSQLPNLSGIYGLSFPSTTEHEIGNYESGVGSHTMDMGGDVEPESYYKAEHDILGRPASVPLPVVAAQTPQHELPQPPYPTSVSSQTTQILQQQQRQHFGRRPPTPRSAGLKRRRDDTEDEESTRIGGIGADMGASQRRRSFTLPSGYRSGNDMGPPQ